MGKQTQECVSPSSPGFLYVGEDRLETKTLGNNHVIYILSSQSFFSNNFFFVTKVSIILTNPCFPNLDHGTTIALVMRTASDLGWSQVENPWTRGLIPLWGAIFWSAGFITNNYCLGYTIQIVNTTLLHAPGNSSITEHGANLQLTDSQWQNSRIFCKQSSISSVLENPFLCAADILTDIQAER